MGKVLRALWVNQEEWEYVMKMRIEYNKKNVADTMKMILEKWFKDYTDI